MSTVPASRPSSLRSPPEAALTRPQHDHILLDGSASMQYKWWPMLSAIDTYIASLREQQVNSSLTLSVFSGHDLDMLQRDCHISAWTPLREAPIGSTWAGTPLYDAINVSGRRLRDLSPTRASILICTDGDENCSQFTTLDQANAILTWMRALGWQVTFIGCDFNNQHQAKLLGGQTSSAIGIQKHLLTDAAQSLARKRAAYGFTGAPMHWSEAEQQQFGGHLAPPASPK